MKTRAQQLLDRSRGKQPGPKRDWRLHATNHVRTCNECGRSIVAMEDHYADIVSGHLARHVGCHEAAEKREARR
jgi:hypothetical protein